MDTNSDTDFLKQMLWIKEETIKDLFKYVEALEKERALYQNIIKNFNEMLGISNVDETINNLLKELDIKPNTSNGGE